ncbi:MAG: VWA domain-containing protein [Pyrinomonadaceae bacterium]
MQIRIGKKYLARVFAVILIIAEPCFIVAQSETTRDFGSSLSKTEFDDGVVRIDTTLVVSDVRVLDKRGEVVPRLQASDFIVSEDNVPQEISTFSLGGDKDGIPKSIILIIDYSGSQLPYITTSIEAAKVLVDKLNPNDKMAIVTDDVEVIVRPSSDKTLLKEKLEGLKISALSGKVGLSRQYSALMAAMKELFGRGDLRPIVIFQTDGDEFMKVTTPRPELYGEFYKNQKFQFKDILSTSDRIGATIYSVIPGVSFLECEGGAAVDAARNHLADTHKANNVTAKPKILKRFLSQLISSYRRDHRSVDRVAKSTGGWTEVLRSPEDADAVYLRILHGINTRYILGYYPKNESRDGRKRSVSVRVKNHPEYKVLGRDGYIASGENY